MHGRVSGMDPRPLKLFHLSDIHFGLEDRRALAWVEQCIARENPHAVAITGDLTMRARHREFDAANAWISALKVPVTVEVGNHDMPYFNLIERFVTPYKRFDRIERMLEVELDLPDLAIVPLKTATRAQWRFPWSNGWVTKRALEETLAAIDAHPPGTRILVAAHHPLTERSPTGKRLTIDGTSAMEALAERKVAAVLSGHVHDPFQEGGGLGTVAGVLIGFLVVQLLEGYILIPKIMGDRTGLHPMVIMIALFFWGSALGGIFGMILAIPLTAFLVVFWRLAREKYMSELV